MARIPEPYVFDYADWLAKEQQRVAESRRRNYEFKLGPVVFLTKIARVCRTFQATIQGSPKLQRVLRGQDDSFDVVHSVPRLPLKWLLEQALGRRETREALELNIYIETEYNYTREDLSVFLGECATHSEASWRRVQVCKELGENYFEMKICFRRPSGYKQGKEYVETIETGNGATLGDVLDRFVTIFRCDDAQHEARLQFLSLGE